MTIPTIIKLFEKTEFGFQHSGLLGGKGAHLAELLRMELPVPPLVNLTTEAYKAYIAEIGDDNIANSYAKAVHQTFWTNGDMMIGENTLVSVRSGAPVSMPGMMDTILNVGLSLDFQDIWEEKFGSEWFWDSYSRLLIQLAEALKFTDLPKHNAEKGFRNAQIVSGRLVKAGVDVDTLTSPLGALRVAIKAVFDSWNTERAIYYRELNDISHDVGTACNIQKMVFGNVGDDSGTGVMFTRNPSNGINILTGEFLVNAQGEDVVDGSITPTPLSEFKKSSLASEISDELFVIAETLESHFLDMQDVEFTIEQGKLWILQTRTAKRTSEAAFRIAVEMVEDEEIELETIIKDKRLTLNDWHSVKGITIKNAPKPTFTGLAAGSGVAQGRAVFTSQAAVDAIDPVILVRPETTPNDIKGMYASVGIVTFKGGMTSHAAVVARGMNKPCIVGVESMASHINEGDNLTIDSANGLIWINEDVEISNRGGSKYADRWVTMLQELKGLLAVREEYRPYSVIQLSIMTDKNFETMIKQVFEAGAWYEQVWLKTDNIAPFYSDQTALTALAHLSLPKTLGPLMKYRRDEIDKLSGVGIKTLFVDDAPIVSDVVQLEEADAWVMVNRTAWEGFLGSVIFEVVKDCLIEEGVGLKVLNWTEPESVVLEELFSEGMI